jgi:hypothetical protein
MAVLVERKPMSQQKPDDVVLSYASKVVPPWWARVLLRPLGWPYFSLLTLGCLWILWAFRLPAPFPNVWIPLFAVIPSLGLLLLLRIVLQLVLWRIYRRPWLAFWAGIWRFGIPVGVGMVVWLAVSLHVPQAVAWRVSEPAMRRHAQRIIATEAARVPPSTEPVECPPQWVGLYRMSEVVYFPDVRGVRYFVAGAGFMDRQGFAFLPGGPPPPAIGPANVVSALYTPMEGDWYSAVEVW